MSSISEKPPFGLGGWTIEEHLHDQLWLIASSGASVAHMNDSSASGRKNLNDGR
jgi:hypothetical protein